MVNNMWKTNKSSWNEILNNLDVNLKKTASKELTRNDDKLIEAVELLNSSAETLEQLGFEKEAELITQLTILAIKGDPHTEHLTTEKMVNNLKNKGIMFDANDQNMAKDHKLPSQEMGYPIIYLTEKDNVLCSKCATEVKKEGEKVTGHMYQEGPTRECEICLEPIESTNGNPDENYGKMKMDDNMAKDHKPTHEGPDEYKREKLEEEYLEEMLENDYDKILGDLDEEMLGDLDEVII